jgi:hypothetical protein
MAPKAAPAPIILWGSFLASQVLYVGLGLSGVLRAAGPMDAANPVLGILPIAFGGLAVVLAIGAHVVHGKTADRPPGPILAWALDEAIAILGLVLCILGAPLPYWLPFSAIGFGLTLLHRPREEASGGRP